MKIIKFYSKQLFYFVSGETELEAIETLFDLAGEMEIDKQEEIPESEWDEKLIEIHDEDDDSLFKASLRELITTNASEILGTNDDSLIY